MTTAARKAGPVVASVAARKAGPVVKSSAARISGPSPDAADPRLALVNAYLASLGGERRLSTHTVDGYRRDLHVLLASIGGLPLDQVGTPLIRRAAAQAHGRGLSGKSVARMLSAWRGLFRWLGRRNVVAGLVAGTSGGAADGGHVTANPAAGVRAPRGPKALPKALSPDLAARLLDLKPEDELEVRDRAMFELLYSSGLRLAELVGLDLAGAREMRGEHEVTVLGKGSKTRRVPVGARALESLEGWLAVRATHAAPEEPALFVGERGLRVSPRVVQLRLKRWARKAGVAADVHPHVLRHSFASHVLQSSGDLRAVQEMLGHASIATTQVYTSLDFQHLAKVYDAAHPRARSGARGDTESRARSKTPAKRQP